MKERNAPRAAVPSVLARVSTVPSVGPMHGIQPKAKSAPSSGATARPTAGTAWILYSRCMNGMNPMNTRPSRITMTPMTIEMVSLVLGQPSADRAEQQAAGDEHDREAEDEQERSRSACGRAWRSRGPARRRRSCRRGSPAAAAARTARRTRRVPRARRSGRPGSGIPIRPCRRTSRSRVTGLYVVDQP